MSPEVLAAIIAGCVALLGYPVASFVASRQDARAKEKAFKLECYQGFLKAFFDCACQRSLETELAFTRSVNLLYLMAAPEMVALVEKLIEEAKNPDKGSEWPILDEIMYFMRRDVLGSRDTISHGYRFRFLVADRRLAEGAPAGQHARREMAAAPT